MPHASTQPIVHVSKALCMKQYKWFSKFKNLRLNFIKLNKKEV